MWWGGAITYLHHPGLPTNELTQTTLEQAVGRPMIPMGIIISYWGSGSLILPEN